MEREHIISWIRTVLRQETSAKLVTRNLRKAASIKELPVIFIVDGGDEIARDSGGLQVQKIMRLDFGLVVEGPTEETAPETMAVFTSEVKKALYGDPPTRAVGHTYRGTLNEVGESPLNFPADTSKVVAKRIKTEVLYAEDIRNLYQ